MKYTKYNILSEIESYLKSNKIRYSLDGETNNPTYNLHVASLECFIQIEYDLNNEVDDSVYIQLYTENDSSGNSIYHRGWNSDKKDEDIIDAIDDLVTSTKQINSAISKIGNKISQIEEICNENNLDMNDFIDVIYDFES